MNRLSRAKALKVAASLSFLISLYGVMVNIPLLAQGSGAIEAQRTPYSVIVILFGLSVMGLLAVYGVWHGHRWALLLTILVALLNVLAAMPGIFFAPIWYWQLSSATITLFGLAVIILCLWRERKPTLI
ncbi:MAG: hypothetical protein U0175_31515 [Caldilineaceae bacterium]